MRPRSPRFRAFISYSHATDRAIAAALAAALTRFAVPWYRLHAMRVFLDQESLVADPALWGSIERALASAQWYVLLACPASAGSEWVRKELAWWRANRSMKHLIVARTGGEIVWGGPQAGDFDWSRTTALPDTLRGVFAEEPVWVDLVDACKAPRMTVRDPAFRAAFLGIAAPIHGVSREALWSLQRVEWRRRIGAAGAAALLIALAVWGTLRERAIAEDRSENIPSIQLGARSFMLQASAPALAARVALAGVARRPSGVAAAALRSALARLAGDSQPQRSADVPGALDIAFAPDAQRLAVLARDGGVTLLAVEGDAAPVLRAPPAALDARAIAWGAGDTLAVAAADGVWLRHGDAAPRRVAVPAARRIAFDAGGTRLAIAHDDGRWRVVAVVDGAVLAAGAVEGGAVDALAFSADGRRLATGGAAAELWELAGSARLARWPVAGGVASLDFNLDGETGVAKWMLVVAARGGPVRVIDPDPAAPPERAVTLQGTEAGSVAARFVRSGRCFAVASAEGPVDVVSGFGFVRLFRLAGSAGRVDAIALAHSTHFAVLRGGRTVEIHAHPLCSGAEDLCRFAQPLMREPMTAEERLKHLPPPVDGPVSQPPGPACSALIARVLGDWR